MGMLGMVLGTNVVLFLGAGGRVTMRAGRRVRV